MFNNFHEIKAVISNHQGFKASFYGMAEYIQGMMSNRFKIKNSLVQTMLYFQARIKDNSIKFKNSDLAVTLLSALKPTENVIKFTNVIETKLISLIKPKESVITFLNKPIQKLNILFEPKLKENEFEFENADTKVNVALQGRTDDNKVLIDNNNEDGVHTTISLMGETDNNKFSFQNGTVNASTWKFLTLGGISGTLNEIEKAPLVYLGRRKIVQERKEDTWLKF